MSDLVWGIIDCAMMLILLGFSIGAFGWILRSID